MRPKLNTVRFDCSEWRAPHVVALASQLNISPALALGHWVRLCACLADAGLTMAEFQTAEELAIAAGWPADDAPRFCAALSNTCIDATGNPVGWAFISQPARRATDERKRVAQADATEREETTNRFAPYFDAWKESYGGLMPAGKNCGVLKKLEDEYGAEEVLRRFKLVLSRNQPQFASAHLLAQGWATYAGDEKAAVPAARRYATAFYDILNKYGILTMAGAGDRIRKLEGEGVIKSADRFIELLRKCNRDTLRDARTPAFAIAHIEERIGSALQG